MNENHDFFIILCTALVRTINELLKETLSREPTHEEFKTACLKVVDGMIDFIKILDETDKAVTV